MCETTIEGYTTKEGIQIKVNNIDKEIPAKVREELQKSNATQLDILYIRSVLENNGKELQTLAKDFKEYVENHKAVIGELKEDLMIEVGNGKSEKRKLKVVISEMYKRERTRRDIKKLKRILHNHKFKVFVIGLIIILLSLAFHKYIDLALVWIGENLINLIKLLLKLY